MGGVAGAMAALEIGAGIGGGSGGARGGGLGDGTGRRVPVPAITGAGLFGLAVFGKRLALDCIFFVSQFEFVLAPVRRGRCLSFVFQLTFIDPRGAYSHGER